MNEKEARRLADVVKLICPIAWVEPIEPEYKIVVEIVPKEKFSIPSFDAFLMFLKWAREHGKI